MPFMTVKEHKERNKHLKDESNEKDFVVMRQERDATLAEPKLIHQSLQMNIRAGRLPTLTPSGNYMLSLPIKLETAPW